MGCFMTTHSTLCRKCCDRTAEFPRNCLLPKHTHLLYNRRSNQNHCGGCKNMDYVRSAKLAGAGNLRIMFVHILPNTVPVLLSAIMIGFNNAVLAEAGMSYLASACSRRSPVLEECCRKHRLSVFCPWLCVVSGNFSDYAGAGIFSARRRIKGSGKGVRRCLTLRI